jgi:hypothetical protein
MTLNQSQAHSTQNWCKTLRIFEITKNLILNSTIKELFKAVKRSEMQFECKNRILLEFGILLRATIILPQFKRLSI